MTSPHELLAHIIERADSLFQALDQDHDGFIYLPDLSLASHSPTLSPQLRSVLALALEDVSGDIEGRVSRRDFMASFRSCAEEFLVQQERGERERERERERDGGKWAFV